MDGLPKYPRSKTYKRRTSALTRLVLIGIAFTVILVGVFFESMPIIIIGILFLIVILIFVQPPS